MLPPPRNTPNKRHIGNLGDNMGTHRNLFGNVMGTHISPHPQPLKKKKKKSWGPWMLVTPSHLLHATSIFKITSHILDTSYLPKLGIVTTMGRDEVVTILYKDFFFWKYLLKSLREKNLFWIISQFTYLAKLKRKN